MWSETEKAALRDEFFGFWPEDRFCDADGAPRLSMLREMFADLERLTPARASALVVRLAKERSGIPTADVISSRVESAMGLGTVVAGPGAWKPPEDTPEEIARSERIREWAQGLDDRTHALLARAAVARSLCPAKFIEGRDLRKTPLARAVLVRAAQFHRPELLPIGLREDIDTRGRWRVKGSRTASEEVVDAVLVAAGVSWHEMFSKNRWGHISKNREITDARAAAAVIMREDVGTSYALIARRLGYGCHSSAICAIRRAATNERATRIVREARAEIERAKKEAGAAT